MNKMKIDIWSDIACPFCYIGKRKLEMALSQFPHKDNVELAWHSYELDPGFPKQSVKSKVYSHYALKYNVSENESRAIMNRTASLAKEVGLNFDFDNLVVTNTSDALRLVKLADEQGLATEAEEILFDAYFVKGLNISAKETLIFLGVSIGLKAEVIAEMLDSDRYKDEIKKDIKFSENTLDLEYIPFYLFNNKEIVQGSIPVEDYLKVLLKSYEKWEKSGVASNDDGRDIISGQSCSIDGVCN